MLAKTYEKGRFCGLAGRIFASFLSLCLLYVFPASEAEAQSNVCAQLSAELIRLQTGFSSGGNSKRARQYDQAIRNQTAQIVKTKKIAKRSGCLNKGIFSVNKNSQRCRRITNGIKKMNANLANLKRTRSKLGGGSSNVQGKRNKILRKMQKHRCNANQQQVANNQPVQKKSKRRTLLEQIFGVRTYGDDGRQRHGIAGDEELANRNNTFRTLCVRKTDGYYFPISFSTLRDRFEQDEQTCSQMCPNTEVGLYYHRMPVEDSEDMIAFGTEQPYAKEPFAFAYRKEFDRNNRCSYSTQADLENVDVNTEGTKEVSRVKTIGVPVWRIDPGLSPSSSNDKAVNFDLANAINYLDKKEEPHPSSEELLASNRKIRIVGPAFYPVQ